MKTEEQSVKDSLRLNLSHTKTKTIRIDITMHVKTAMEGVVFGNKVEKQKILYGCAWLVG